MQSSIGSLKASVVAAIRKAQADLVATFRAEAAQLRDEFVQREQVANASRMNFNARFPVSGVRSRAGQKRAESCRADECWRWND